MIVIKPSSVSDVETLVVLGRKTFLQTFAKDNSQEDMELYLRETFGPKQQSREIQDPDRRIAIAWDGKHAIGYYHLIMSVPDPSVIGSRPIEILRLYLDSNWHGKGIGAAMIEDCIEVSRKEGFKTLWLGVWEHNHRAQAFYRKYLFKKVGEHIFKLGRDNQTDLIMARAI